MLFIRARARAGGGADSCENEPVVGCTVYVVVGVAPVNYFVG